MAHLAAAVDPASEPSVVAVFGLGGLDEFEKSHGKSETDRLIARLAEEFARMVRPEGVCYAPRRREFVALFDLPLGVVSRILAPAAIALRRVGAIASIAIAFGTAVLPGQASSPISALVVADRNLSQARRAQRRARALAG